MSLETEIDDLIAAIASSVNAKVAANKVPPYCLAVTIPGPATVRSGTTKIPVPSGNYTISEVRVTAGTAPTGSSLIVDINKNGTTIYSGGTGRPSIAASATSGTDGTPSTSTCSGGDWFTIDIDQVGSTVAGSTICVLIELTRTS